MSRFQNLVDHAAQLKQALGPFTRAILTVTPQGVFAVPVEDMFVGAELRIHGQYAPEELQQLRSLCNDQTRLLIVGGHIGAIAIPMARTCKSVVAIEANPKTFELLNLNVGLNGLQNCRVIHKAASNKHEQIEFVLNTVNTGGSKRAPINRNEDFFYDQPQIAKVDAAPLDELLAGESFDAILMDIEGSEYFALQGMQRILSTASVLQIEFMPHHLKDVAGISVDEFLAPISPHFSTLIVGSRQLIVGRDQFAPTLQDMYSKNESAAAVHFLKAPPETIRFGTPANPTTE